MGHRKRTPISHRKALPEKVESPATVQESPPPMEIKQECERALNALRRGNHNKALRLMKESASKFDNSALYHRVAGTIYVKVAGIIDDTAVKHRHLKNAVDAAKRAVTLSPNSVEFAHFYANLLFEAASDGKDYEEVIAECERALGLENPIDPAKESLSGFEKDETVSFSKEAKETRIGNIQSELRALIQKSNISSISSWMKNLGGGIVGDDKYRLIPLRRVAEDPLESRYLSGNGNVRRPNEIKKASKTPEERRQEILVRVTAARLLQQTSDQCPGVGEESKGSGGGGSLLSSSVSGSGGGGNGNGKVGERRRHGSWRRNATISERKDQARSYWNSMSFEMKRGLLRVRVSDLRAHFSGSSSKDMGQACDVLCEALAFGEMSKTWRFWACCRCGGKFPDGGAHRQHVRQEHLGTLLPKAESVLPQNVDSEWAEMLISCSWKPLDLAASVRMLEDRSKPEDSECSSRKNHTERIDNCWSDGLCSEEVWESFQEKKSLAENCNGSYLEGNGEAGIANVECKTCDVKEGPKVCSLPNSWPLSDDTERAKLLEKISSLFQVMVRHKCLGVTHLQKVIHFTMEDLQGLFPGSQILSCGVDQTPLCICFLGAGSLRNIIKYLQELCHSCGLGRFPEKISPDDASDCTQGLDCEDNIILNESASSLLLDESLLHSGGGSGNLVGDSEMGGRSDSESLLSWIYAGPPSGEQFATWSKIREEKSQEGLQLLGMLEKEFGHLENLCDRKYEHLGYEEALQGLEELCAEECKRREHVNEFPYRSYDSILRRRRDELAEGENDVMFISNRLELEAISNVLKEAETLNVNQFGYEDTYGGVASHLSDLEAGEDDWRSKDYLHHLDTCIDSIIERQKEHIHTELGKLDAQMMRTVDNMQQLELKLEPVSAFDYRIILLPLVKSFMQAYLEDLAEKDATEKSDAAREAFLAELALDSKKGSGNGNDSSKHTQEKLKDKKKNKDSRRTKDSKVGNFNIEQLEAAEHSSLAATSDGDPVEADIVDSGSGVCIKELDDEIRRKIELEAEERKLEETLEYQRRLENEAKQKLLAEQRRRNALAASEDVVEELRDGFVNLGISVAVHCKQDPLLSKNVCADNIDNSQRNPMSGTDCSAIAEGSDGGALIDGVLPFEQRMGRKGKRRNSTKVPEGKYQPLSCGKEIVRLENSATDRMPKDEVPYLNGALSHSVGDGGSKTLRQLQAEEDEEERFQADLKKAVRQSLDTYQARQKLPLVPNSMPACKSWQVVDNLGAIAGENVNEIDLFGAGLQNEVGEYNCFLNVIIQSLWHLIRFRDDFLRRSTSEHVHVGDPCVVCALFDILTALSIASVDAKREPVAPTTLRIALSNLRPESNFFKEGQMNDASEVLSVIFECLHRSFTSGSGGSDSGSAESNCPRSWDCSSASCIAHTLFGMDIFNLMQCHSCGLESRHMKYTSFFHDINATALRTMKVMCPENSFGELLRLMENSHLLACDPQTGGCGTENHICHILSNPPHIFTAVLGWQNTCESVDDIKATLAALETEIDLSTLYRGLDSENLRRLVSVVCYYGQHYHCFAYSHDHERWIMYDDKTVKVIGTWKEVLSMCERGHLQPQVLFYEAVN